MAQSIARKREIQIGRVLTPLDIPVPQPLLSARAAADERGQSASNTSVILFWMWGGPSQLETWDMKPRAPTELRHFLN